MTVTQAVRRDRPSTRSTRGTNTITKDSAKNITSTTIREPRVRPSTRGVNETGVQNPRRKASTRNRPADRPAPATTRVRASTRGGSQATQNKAKAKQSEFPSRTQVYGEKREMKRNAAPLQFIMVMFFVVIVSVFAFGLLRDDSIAQKPERPDDGPTVEVFYEKKGTTSTNTGILRGN